MNTYRNLSFVDDAKLRELAQAQRREKDPARRKALLDALSREEAQQQYYIHFTSGVYVASWPSYVKNFNTNLGYTTAPVWRRPGSRSPRCLFHKSTASSPGFSLGAPRSSVASGAGLEPGAPRERG
jgi:hypothetical protein